jgi:hypothetical protein
MPSPKLPLKGSCLCGAVNVTLTAPPILSVACHCRDCQKFTASAFSLTLMFPRDSFSITGDLVTGGLHSKNRTHHFCASCQNFIYSELAFATHRINLRTSVLDTAVKFPPFVEVMAEDKLPWVQVPVHHSYARAPARAEELQQLMDEYARM